MPFSSVLGASSVIKPGVCTSTTRPSVPYEGQLIYETDTDLVLAYNGSSWRAVSNTAAPNGSVLQVVNGTTSTEVSTTSTSYITTNITATITPSSTSSKVLAIWSTTAGKDTTIYSSANFALFRGTVAGTNLGVATLYDVDSGSRGGVGFSYLDSPSTTSAQAYTVGIKSNSSLTTVYANYGNILGSITLMEISA